MTTMPSGAFPVASTGQTFTQGGFAHWWHCTGIYHLSGRGTFSAS